MEKQIKKLQQQQKQIQKKLDKATEIASRELLVDYKFKDVLQLQDIPPYALTLLSLFHFGHDLFEDITSQEPENGRVRSKFEKGVEKAFVGAYCGAMLVVTVPAAIIMETPIALPYLGIVGIQSAIYTNYNKNIEKAKIKVELLKDQNKQIQEEINKLQKQKEEQELSL